MIEDCKTQDRKRDTNIENKLKSCHTKTSPTRHHALQQIKNQEGVFRPRQEQCFSPHLTSSRGGIKILKIESMATGKGAMKHDSQMG